MSTQLWAPWRMEYLQKPKEEGCVFCKYAQVPASARREHLILAATDQAYVVMNRYPFTSGHLLVIPNHHTSDLEALPDPEYVGLFELVRSAAARLKRAVRAQGLNIGINLGEAAGAGIAAHLHVHIVPRWNGDTNFMPVFSDVRVIPQHLETTYDHLLPHFADVTDSVTSAGGS